MSNIPKMSALMKAQDFPHLCAAKREARSRRRRPLRLPIDLWDQVEGLAQQLQNAFPNRYVTVNSTIEFLLTEALSEALTEVTPLRSKKNNENLDELHPLTSKEEIERSAS